MSAFLILGYIVWILLCFNVILSEKLTYEWSINVTAGSLLPSEHLSQYDLDGTVSIYIANDTYNFQIDNVHTSGVEYDLETLQLPFSATISDDDATIYTQTDDHPWAVNLKKSVVSFFVFKKDNFQYDSYARKENTSYGICDVEYIVKKLTQFTQIRKLIDEQSCTNSPNIKFSNTPLFMCPSTFKEGIATYNERLYQIRHDNAFINNIFTVGSIHYQPFQALAEAHYVHVSQNLTLINIENDLNPVTINSSYVSSNIVYVSEIHQPTSGKIPSNRTLLVSMIHQKLEELTESLNWELDVKGLDNQTSYHILELMSWLNLDDWELLYSSVTLGTSYQQETTQHFFWDLVPQVGSESSAAFIKCLITSKRVKGMPASLLLTTFPLHMKRVTEKFVIEIEDMLRLTDVEEDVKNSGILSFATLIRKVCTNRYGVELRDKYTKYFLDKFTEASNYQDRMVYIQALHNMQLDRIFDFLTPIITDSSYGRHMRYLAIWCTFPIIEKQKQKATEMFWPIFTNLSEPLEIRVSAMSVLLQTQPSSSRLLTLYWFMKAEPNYHVYNFFYTTVHSLANTKYPCYSQLRHTSSQLSRYLLPRAYRWATGNYMVDYEDQSRGYGGLVHLLVVASEITGLPSSAYLTTEHHSHGLTSKYSIFVKMEGIMDAVQPILQDLTNITHLNADWIHKFRELNLTAISSEEVHVEIMLRIDGNTLYCKHLNRTSLLDILLSIKHASSLYYAFSVNYQRLRFPLRYEAIKLTDLGTPVALHIRTTSLLSLRGSIMQIDKGKNRDAELDFRYSMSTVTSLKTFNPLKKEWHGTDRTRSLHTRIPFSTHLDIVRTSFFKMTAKRHKHFGDGSQLGLVWHSTIKLFPEKLETVHSNGNNTNSSYYWSIESRDLGARFDVKVFDCQTENDITSSLTLIKEAFQLTNKNYKMFVGGAPLLGIYSFANYFTFLPPGDSCGIIISMAPLQFQLVLLKEGDIVRLSMITEKNVTVWDLFSHYREKDDEGSTNINFHMEHSNEERNFTIINGSWRLIQFQGEFKMPSFHQGVLKAPGPAEGQAKLAWGHVDQATSIEMELKSENTAKNWPQDCENNTAICLQTAGNLATQQSVNLNCVNLPIWVTTALLSVFPDNVEANKKSTKIQFSIPAKVPWTTHGFCVINANSVLNFDNATVFQYSQNSYCYSVGIADCSGSSQFIVGITKSEFNNELNLKVLLPNYTLKIFSRNDINVTQVLTINDADIPITNSYAVYPAQSNNNRVFRLKRWPKSNMLEIILRQGELVLQHYRHTVVAIAAGSLRGKTCGLCGDFNGEVSNDRTTATCVKDLA